MAAAGQPRHRVVGSLASMLSFFGVQHFLDSGDQSLPKVVPHKAWLNGTDMGIKAPYLWEQEPFFAVPADDNGTAWVVRGLLQQDEVEHILTSVLPVAGFHMDKGGGDWDETAPLAGAALSASPDTERYDHGLNWSTTSGLSEGPDPVLLRIEERITNMTGIPYHDRESPLQIGRGRPHTHRGVAVGKPLHHDLNARFNRVLSVIMYLSDGEHDDLVGGHTLFPCLRPYAEGAKELHRWEAKEATAAAAAEKIAYDRLSIFEKLAAYARQWPFDFIAGLKGFYRSEPRPVCSSLQGDFKNWRLIHVHPHAIDFELDDPRTDGDTETPTRVNEMCEQAFASKPEVLLMTPKRGDAILFLSALPDSGEHVPQTWHQGCPVKRGTKLTLQKFKEVPYDGYGEEFEGTRFARKNDGLGDTESCAAS